MYFITAECYLHDIQLSLKKQMWNNTYSVISFPAPPSPTKTAAGMCASVRGAHEYHTLVLLHILQ